ncbi:methionyl-tRNA formyltransferase [Aestuariivivens sediminicola]|uniref:methionyl-tRNA formyltransferase n=1 Tax=Aestuariivivens sediminicola TaxID=2913560 RepID=UPI001F574FF0|nr:methionyl-tRNA formyltransferase [Aestuariivivens sediminicola]
MLKLGILCSGHLGYVILSKIVSDYKVSFVLTDSNSDSVIKFTENCKIPVFKGNPRKGRAYNFIKDKYVDVIISINYLFLIENDIITHPKLLAFNIHGSLLPKYRGRTPHVWAIINGEKKAGITAHLIDSGCDTGKIINQTEVPIGDDDTGASILKKYETAYYPLIKKVLSNIYNLSFKEQDESQATYFGKRTPNDGEINWNWTREYIRNWVRAQAYPYPGAFTYYDNKKIIIDEVSFSDEKINDSQSNGELIKVNRNVIVKTKNGALKLDKIRTENCKFTQGNTLGNENRR